MASSFGYASASGPGCRGPGTNIAGGTINGARSGRTINKLGRPLSYDDIKHYRKIVLALRETRQLMAEIDQIIPEWPVEQAEPEPCVSVS